MDWVAHDDIFDFVALDAHLDVGPLIVPISIGMAVVYFWSSPVI